MSDWPLLLWLLVATDIVMSTARGYYRPQQRWASWSQSPVATIDHSSHEQLTSRCPSLLCYHCSDVIVATCRLPVAMVAYDPVPTVPIRSGDLFKEDAISSLNFYSYSLLSPHHIATHEYIIILELHKLNVLICSSWDSIRFGRHVRLLCGFHCSLHRRCYKLLYCLQMVKQQDLEMCVDTWMCH
jgi:hypothetical protein